MTPLKGKRCGQATVTKSLIMKGPGTVASHLEKDIVYSDRLDLPSTFVFPSFSFLYSSLFLFFSLLSHLLFYSPSPCLPSFFPICLSSSLFFRCFSPFLSTFPLASYLPSVSYSVSSLSFPSSFPISSIPSFFLSFSCFFPVALDVLPLHFLFPSLPPFLP